MNELLEEHKKLIYCVINRLDFIPDKIDKDDLIQIGYIALWEALKDYDESYGFELSTHCYKKIRAKIIDYLRQQTAMKRKDIIKLNKDNSFEDILMLDLLLNEISQILSRDIYLMFIDKYLHKLTIKDLIVKYGLSKSQIEYRLKQAKQIVINTLTNY